jgi:hypothetical protein
MGDCNMGHMPDASRRGHVRHHVLLDLVETGENTGDGRNMTQEPGAQENCDTCIMHIFALIGAIGDKGSPDDSKVAVTQRWPDPCILFVRPTGAQHSGCMLLCIGTCTCWVQMPTTLVSASLRLSTASLSSFLPAGARGLVGMLSTTLEWLTTTRHLSGTSAELHAVHLHSQDASSEGNNGHIRATGCARSRTLCGKCAGVGVGVSKNAPCTVRLWVTHTVASVCSSSTLNVSCM